jgi:hypothetical protein
MMPFMNQLVRNNPITSRHRLILVLPQFSARTGGGAFLNEKTLLPLTGRPQPLESLQECVVSMECTSGKPNTFDVADPRIL